MANRIKYEVKDKIATISINNPEGFNALYDEDYISVAEAVEKASADENVKAIVLTGEGPLFSGGGNVKFFRELIDNEINGIKFEPLAMHTAIPVMALKKSPKPTIAMMNGICYGAGFSLAMACDMRVASPGTRVSAAFVKMAFSGDTGVWYTLRECIGLAKATELMMLGDEIKGKAIYDMGIANRFAEDDSKLAEETYALAARLAKGPTATYACQKQLIWKIFYKDYEAYMVEEAKEMAACSSSDDFKEAVDAFLNKRAPQFTGK